MAWVEITRTFGYETTCRVMGKDDRCWALQDSLVVILGFYINENENQGLSRVWIASNFGVTFQQGVSPTQEP